MKITLGLIALFLSLSINAQVSKDGKTFKTESGQLINVGDIVEFIGPSTEFGYANAFEGKKGKPLPIKFLDKSFNGTKLEIVKFGKLRFIKDPYLRAYAVFKKGDKHIYCYINNAFEKSEIKLN